MWLTKDWISKLNEKLAEQCAGWLIEIGHRMWMKTCRFEQYAEGREERERERGMVVKHKGAKGSKSIRRRQILKGLPFCKNSKRNSILKVGKQKTPYDLKHFVCLVQRQLEILFVQQHFARLNLLVESALNQSGGQRFRQIASDVAVKLRVHFDLLQQKFPQTEQIARVTVPECVAFDVDRKISKSQPLVMCDRTISSNKRIKVKRPENKWQGFGKSENKERKK